MKWFAGFMAVLIGVAFLRAQETAPSEATPPKPVAASESAAEKSDVDSEAIRKAINSYVEAFNKGDAKAVAAHWTARGEFVTPAGKILRGREELEQDFAAYFKDSANAKVEILDTSIAFLAPSVASETGFARVIVPDREPIETRYKAIHVKTVEGWKIDRVSEEESSAVPATHYEQLKNLEWMVGRWVNKDDDDDDDVSVDTECRWTTNRNFLVRSFKVSIENRVDFEGTQIIGWDSHAQTIRSWIFDSDGGVGISRWSGGNGRWTVQTLNVLPDGRRASATNIYEVMDDQTVKFQTIGRQVDGELLPNVAPVTVVRAAGQ